MNHYRQLAHRLRRRHLAEEDVARVLADVRDLSGGSPEVAQREFGPAQTYAENFPEGTARWTWTRFAGWAVFLVGIAVLVLGQELSDRGAPFLPWWAVLGVWLATTVAGSGLRSLLDHRLPRGFTAGAVPAPRTGLRPAPPPDPEREEGTGATTASSYYRDLAFHLRLRQLPEAEVARVLEDVRELVEVSGSAPEAEFGPAQQYAGQFERRERRRSPSVLVFSACALLGLAVGLADVVTDLRGEAWLPPGVRLLVFAGLLVAGGAFAVTYDSRLPRAFRDARGGARTTGR